MIIGCFSFSWWSHINFFLWFINWLKVHKVSGHIHIKLFFEMLEVLKSMIILSFLCEQFHLSLIQNTQNTCSYTSSPQVASYWLSWLLRI